MALARKYRLTQKDSEHVLRKGETVKNSFFFIRFSKNRVGHCRMAILVSMRVSKKSTARNRLRRMVTEIFKAAGLEGQPFDIVFVATPGIVGKQSREIKSGLMDVINAVFVNPIRDSQS